MPRLVWTPTGVETVDDASSDNQLLEITTLQAAVDAIEATALDLGAGTAATAGRVTLASDDPAVAKLTTIASRGLSAAVSVTRPSDTTAYLANDVCGPTGGGTSGIDFNLGAISGSHIVITSVSLERDVAALISGETSYNLYLYSITPPSALADNAPFDLPSGDRASFLGKIDMGTPVDEGSTLYIEKNNINKQVKLAGTHIFGYLVTVGPYTPASATVLKITLNAAQV